MRWLHNLLKGASLTGALFVFQACYGTPQNPLWEHGEARMDFKLVSHETGDPLEGIDILVKEGNRPFSLGKTGEDGRCRVQIPYYRNQPGPVLNFMDSTGVYMSKDTVLADLREREILVKMDAAQ